ncbi:hypothetical protein [Photobacterium leiognathi]|uniref:hypothetical protein n=1 Tax=Photobacterium leiognathi TaxID=553611 RepID=UPI002738A1B4|nr:hypothetical protein [Photobacterium leiognathi]
MSKKHLCKILITTFTLITLTITSVVSSAPVMTIKMLSMSQNNSMEDHKYCSELSESEHHKSITGGKHCKQDIASKDICCSVACISFFAYVPNHDVFFSWPSQLVKIVIDTYNKYSAYPHSLYRPPIV